MTRAAVLIGVNTTGNAPLLHDAVNGAKLIAKWAEQQQMKVVRLMTDEAQPVRAHEIFAAIKEIAVDGADQLIVYFAGHGVNIGYAERWLLSDAPGDPNAAVNVAGSAEVAHHSSIGHVVFISDACRTAAEGLQAQGVTGSIIFPNTASGGPEKQVDQFWATRLGDPAHEIKDPKVAADRYTALYTEALFAALWGDRLEVVDDDPPDTVVRPWKLKEFLRDDVRRRIKALNLGGQMIQDPDARITSNPQAWVSRLTAAPRPAEAGPTITDKQFVRPPKAAAGAGDNLEFVTRSLLRLAARGGPVLDETLQRARTDDVRGSKAIADGIDRSLNPTGPDHFETECGFKVQGARIVTAVAKRATAQVLGHELVRIGHVQPPGANVLIVFDTGAGAVLPAIPGFIGALTVDEGSLADVAYEPSRQTWRWDQFKQNATRIRTLRGVAAAATRSGLFRLDADDAPAIARAMQYAKGLDPTLAVYAAYAYLDLRRRDRIKEMSHYMRRDLDTRLFDLAMLAGELNGRAVRGPEALPFFPLLSQGWPLLAAYGVKLPGRLSTDRGDAAALGLDAVRRRGRRAAEGRHRVGRGGVMKELVFIHGRSQEKKSSIALKAAWIAAWKEGLDANGLHMPLAETDIHFPYYGQTLYDLVGGIAAAKAAAVVIRGTPGGEAEQQFVNAVLMETAEQLGIPPEEIADASGEPAVRRGALNWSWVQGILRVIDQKVTDGSAAAIAIGTKDVYRYLYDPVIGVDIDAGVREAIKPNVPTVVVTHSLGTVVGYRLLTREGVTRKWRVPLFVTLGSPLGVGAVRQALMPVRTPECADAGYRAMDTRDVVALYPLDTGHFNLKPAIENNTRVRNQTSSRHGIEGYLSDKEVARRVNEAVR